jgi:hypothetical protein
LLGNASTGNEIERVPILRNPINRGFSDVKKMV